MPSLWRSFQVRIAVALFRLPTHIHNLFSGPKPPPTRKVFIPSSDKTHHIQLNLYDPPDHDLKGSPPPVHVTFHGSGFVSPSIGTDAPFCALLARELKCIVIDVDYRLAPEHPFPAPFEDAMSVLEWVRSNPDGQFNTEKVSTGGFSAGGNLALAVCGQLPPGAVKGVVLLYPSIDFTVPYPEKKPPPPGKAESGMAIPIFLGTILRDAYCSDYKNMADPRLSPWLADLLHFPGEGKTLLVTVEFDYLRGEVETFRDRLMEAGKEPVYMEMKGQGHGWDTSAKDGTDAGKKRDEAYAKALEVLRRAYAD